MQTTCYEPHEQEHKGGSTQKTEHVWSSDDSSKNACIHQQCATFCSLIINYRNTAVVLSVGP